MAHEHGRDENRLGTARESRGEPSHRSVTPRILYFGTPVVLMSTLNEDGSPNLAPMSSAWWLGHRCVLGLCAQGRTFENLERDGQIVLNLASVDLVDAVDRLALTTGSTRMPAYKQRLGFETVRDKFARAGLTPEPSIVVAPPRVRECAVQLEAVVETTRPLGPASDRLAVIDTRIVHVHLSEHILDATVRHHVDPDRWRPLIMNFLEFYGLGVKVRPSRLAPVF